MNNKYKLTEIDLVGLTPLESTVLSIRYGIGKREDYTLDDICRGMTRERFRHIESKAMMKIMTSRHYS